MLQDRCTRKRLKAARSRFSNDTKGNISITFGLSVISLFVAVGGSVDMMRALSANTKIQAAMDSAVLAGGRALQISPTNDSTVAIAAAQNYYNQMKPSDVSGAAPDFQVIEGSTVLKGVVSFAIATPFLKLIGIPQIQQSLMTEAALASGGNTNTSLEVSLMLDTTGSMGGQKIEDLKAAAKELIDIVVWNDQSQQTSKVALAPFAPRVNVGDLVAQVTGMSATWSGRKLRQCVTDRTGTYATTDAAPGSGAWLNAYGGNRDSNTTNYTSSGDCTAPAEQVIPLTGDKDVLKSKIDAFTAGGATAGALGTAWAWYLLSPNWAPVLPEGSKPRSYADVTTLNANGSPKLRKIAVLMSDGIYNTTGGVNYGDTSSQATTISNNAVALCNGMKAAGIKVYTVGFQLGGSQLAINTLKACASAEPNDPADNPSYFFNVESGDELKAAFRQIALQLATLRLRS